MSKSSRLRLSDVRAVFRLVGDRQDAGRDPSAWNAVLVAGLTRQLGCYMSQTFLATRVAGGDLGDALMLADDWPDSAARRWWVEFLRQGQYNQLPSIHAFSGPFPRPMAARREDVIPTAEWLMCSERNELRRKCDQDEYIYSGAPVVGPPGRFLGLSVNRPFGDPAFNLRERNHVQLLHGEIARLVGTRLVLTPGQFAAGLSPRLRDVLDALMEGDSEKQVAARLGLSKHTVHEYVIALYRRFEVRSRADLIRACLRPPADSGA